MKQRFYTNNKLIDNENTSPFFKPINKFFSFVNVPSFSLFISITETLEYHRL